MTDISMLSDDVLTILRLRGHDDVTIKDMRSEDVFNEVCEYKGLKNVGRSLYNLALNLNHNEVMTHLKSPTKALLEQQLTEKDKPLTFFGTKEVFYQGRAQTTRLSNYSDVEIDGVKVKENGVITSPQAHGWASFLARGNLISFHSYVKAFAYGEILNHIDGGKTLHQIELPKNFA